MEGPVNAVAPDMVTNHEYTKVIKSVRGKGLIFKIPAFVFKTMFGEMSQIILKGTKIKSKLHNNGFVFEFPKLDGAMRNLLG
jgi:NAD dependent epimerase/dehydratase family enzyme